MHTPRALTANSRHICTKVPENDQQELCYSIILGHLSKYPFMCYVHLSTKIIRLLLKNIFSVIVSGEFHNNAHNTHHVGHVPLKWRRPSTESLNNNDIRYMQNIWYTLDQMLYR